MPKQLGSFYRVGDIIDGFVKRGCRYQVAEDFLVGPDGDTTGVGYLVNPQTNDVQPVQDLGLDHGISERELAQWERRLAIKLPRPPK